MNTSRMSRVTQVSVCEFDPRQYVTQHVNERDVIIWREIFEIFDTDHDGKLAPRDLLEAMSKYNGYKPKRSYIYQTLAVYDKDQSGDIDFKQFLRMVFQKPYEKDTTEDIKRVFNQIDTELKGYLEEEDLRNLADELKQQLTEEDIKFVMAKLDPKRTGKISLHAFLEFNREKIY